MLVNAREWRRERVGRERERGREREHGFGQGCGYPA